MLWKFPSGAAPGDPTRLALEMGGSGYNANPNSALADFSIFLLCNPTRINLIRTPELLKPPPLIADPHSTTTKKS